MVTTDAVLETPIGSGVHVRGSTFAVHHKYDRNFFLALVALMWLGILMGFVPEIVSWLVGGECCPWSSGRGA